MPANPYAAQIYQDLLVELEHARLLLAQARVGCRASEASAQRAIEAIDHVEAAWGSFGRQHLHATRAALRWLLHGSLPRTEECIEAVRELSSLLQEHARGDTRLSATRHYAFQ